MAVLGFTGTEARTYLLMMLSWVSIVQVNLLEQPYARSLVVCDTPTNTTPGAQFSGSRFCGDRLHVINVGADISGKGQSLENVGRISITLFVSAFADSGRRPAAIFGQALLTVSTLLFFLAGFVTSLALPIYVIAQWLQGMSGIGIMDEIITGDVALETGDSVGVYKRKNMVMAVAVIVFFPLTLYLQYAEFQDFTWVWLGINGLNLGTLLLLVFFFPETLSADKKLAETSVRTMISREMQTFREMVSTRPYIRHRLLESFVNGVFDPAAIGMPFCMAHFGISQLQAMIYGWLPSLLLTPIFLPLAPYLHRRLGYRFAYELCFWVPKIMNILFIMGVPGLWMPFLQSWGPVPGPIVCALMGIPFVGAGTISQAVELRLIGQADNAKYQAMAQLVGFVCGAFSSYAFTVLFNAEATSTFGKMLPYYVSIAGSLVQLPVRCLLTAPAQLEECQKLEKEEASKADGGTDAKPAGGEANGRAGNEASDKKTD